MFRLHFLLVLLLPCMSLAEKKDKGEEIVYVEKIKKGPLVTLPIPFSESDKLVEPANDTLGTILDCDVQNRISDPSATNQGYSFLRCTQLLAKREMLPTLLPLPILPQILPNETEQDSGSRGDDDDPRFAAYGGGRESCQKLIFNALSEDNIRYQIQERGIKMLVVNFGIPGSNRTSHLVWTASYGAEYLLEQSMWYRLFSFVPMSMSASEVGLFSNDTGDLDQDLVEACEDFLYLPEISSEDRLEELLQIEASLIYGLRKTVSQAQDFRSKYNSAICARVTDDNETVSGHFESECHLDYVCCQQRRMGDCHEVLPMPCLLLFYKILLYVVWWLVAVPVFLVLPFHAAYERCDSNGNHDRKHGDYYKINSTSSMLFTLVCESIATKFVVYIMLILLMFYQIWAEFGRFDNWLDIPWWVYLFFLVTLLLVPLFKIFWELWGKNIDAELHRPTKFAQRIVKDTFWGAVDLPERCQFRETLLPTRSAIRLHIIYRLRLLLSDQYWVFCARDLPRRCCKNKICGILLAPLTIILGLLNALPAIYLLACLINACKNRKKIHYMKKRWLGFLISLIILVPVIGVASYTVLMILYHSTSIVILDLSALPVVVLYIFLLDYVWQNLRRMNFIYLEIIAFLIEEHQKVIGNMHKGKLGVTQHADVYDNSEVPTVGVKRRPRQNNVYNRSFRDTLRRQSNMAALRAESPKRKSDGKKSDDKKPPKNKKMYSLDFEDRAASPKSPTSSAGAPLIPGGVSSSYWVPAPNTLHLLLHYHGHVLYINKEFHEDLLDTLLPPSVCAFKLVVNIMILGFGYAILDEFFRCYAPFVPCCLYIIFFLVLGLSRLLLAIQHYNNRYPQDLKIQVRALVENFYVKLYVDPDETGRLDLVLTSNVDSMEVTDIESVTTADDVPLWPGRISFKEDPGYDGDYNGSIRSREPPRRVAARRAPLPHEPMYSSVPPKQERVNPTQAAPPKRSPVKPAEPTRAPTAPTQPKKTTPTVTVPAHTVTPKPRAEPKPKPVPVASPEPDPEERPVRIVREPPRQSQSLPRVASPPRSQPQSYTLPRKEPQPTTSTTSKTTTTLTVQYVPLIDRPSRPTSQIDLTEPQDVPDGKQPQQPRQSEPPKQQRQPPRQALPPSTSPTRAPRQSPPPGTTFPDPRYIPREPGTRPQQVAFPDRRPKTTTVYITVPKRPHPKPAAPYSPYREVQSEPEIPFCDDETSEDDLLYDDRLPVGQPGAQPVEHSTTYTILPALEEEPNPQRTATLKRHLKDRYSQPDPVQLFLPDGGYHTLQHQPPRHRASAGPAYYRRGTPSQAQQLSRSYEDL